MRRRNSSKLPYGWLACSLLLPLAPVLAQVPAPAAQQLLRQQERERALREQQEAKRDVRLQGAEVIAPDRIPGDESPCFHIQAFRLGGEGAGPFRWALDAIDQADDPATGRCLGTAGVNTVMKRVQNAIIARGFVTTRVLAPPQDLKGGTLTLTVVPGRIRAIRFAEGTQPRATLWSAVPAEPGDLLNLRDIEQGLEMPLAQWEADDYARVRKTTQDYVADCTDQVTAHFPELFKSAS